MTTTPPPTNVSATDPVARARLQASLFTAVVAAIFTATVAVLLVLPHLHVPAEKLEQAKDMHTLGRVMWLAVSVRFYDATDDFENSPELNALRAELKKAEEKNDVNRITDEILVRDQELRTALQERQTFERAGGWLLAAGAVIFLIAASRAAAYRRRLPHPHPDLNEPQKALTLARLARWSVAGVALAVAGGGVATAVLVGAGVVDLTPPKEVQSSLAPAPTAEQLAAEWPVFRGPGGLGLCPDANAPDTWDGTTGAGILWKAPLPLPGHNSPIVWGDRVFLTGADKTQRVVYCFDAATGRTLWQQPVKTAAGSAVPVVTDETGFAASTACTDGRAVYAIFANADVACFDFSGKPLWARNVGPFSNSYGHATSLLTYKNFLLVQLDQGLPGKSRSSLLALDVATGKTAWETRRNVPQSWATPILIATAQGDQLITCAKPWVIAYNPENGAELWRAGVLEGEIAPSAVFGGGLVYVVNVSAKLTALRTDGTGDVTEKAVAWQAEDGLPDIASPLTDGKRLWLLTTEGGKVTCYDAKAGKPLYEHELKVTCKASPSLAGDRVYVTEEEGGVVHILAAADGKELGKNPLGENVDACLAFHKGRIFIRGAKNLYAVGKPAAGTGAP
jgi:outer membrane protein assembly factor BamB